MAIIPSPLLHTATYSILSTDAYKIAMALAGFPLRVETFEYVHRQGGPHYMPFDPSEVVKKLLPALDGAIDEHVRWLTSKGYPVGPSYITALEGSITVEGIREGTWFFDREPAFTVTGPSALVSWLEPLVLRLNYPIQVATVTVKAKEEFGRDEGGLHRALDERIGLVTCLEQLEIVRWVMDKLEVDWAPGIDETFQDAVREKADDLIRVVEDPNRLFEVGMRAATCEEHHRLVLTALREAGIQKTSNCALAHELGMTPVGTMGHEHVQRFGSDERAFRAMRDRLAGPSSFLLDTFSTIQSGIPTALKLLAEEDRGDGMRYDSGDKVTQYLVACSQAKGMKLNPLHTLEDSFNLVKTVEFERLREFTGVRPEKQIYGYGGWFNNHGLLTRDRVSAVFKLSETAGKAVMKFGDEPGAGKESIPGKPVGWRLQLGSHVAGPIVMIGQRGETPPAGWRTRADSRRLGVDEAVRYAAHGICYSPETQRLVTKLYAERGF